MRRLRQDVVRLRPPLAASVLSLTDAAAVREAASASASASDAIEGVASGGIMIDGEGLPAKLAWLQQQIDALTPP